MAQVTFSTIGDVSVAVSEAAQKRAVSPQITRWLPILGFFASVYLLSSGVALYSFKSAPWVRAFLVPLLPVLIGTAAFVRRQTWKFRAQAWGFQLKLGQDALATLGHEVTNGVNAIRANLIAFRLANSQVLTPEHLDEIESGAKRVEAAVRELQSPAGWKKDGKKTMESNSSSRAAQTARSRIAP